MRFEEHEYEGNTFFRVLDEDLEEYAVALDAFPNLTATDRDYILRAVELAPVVPPLSDYEQEAYFDSEAFSSWAHAAVSILDPVSVNRWAVTLDEASGYASIVTKADILAALHRGARLVAG